MGILFIVLLTVIVVYTILAYNGLVRLRLRTKEALSDIDVQLKRRYNLIPNLVETVKGYMQHEKSVLENVTKARTEAMGAGGNAVERTEKENMLSNTLKTLFAVSENYPDLKANANFLELQRELSDTENKIQASRRFYNAVVQEYNAKIQVFPSNILANSFKFEENKFFTVENEAERENIKVKI